MWWDSLHMEPSSEKQHNNLDLKEPQPWKTALTDLRPAPLIQVPLEEPHHYRNLKSATPTSTQHSDEGGFKLHASASLLR